ncbi:hypothetical protein GUJ93_ZPchr0013g34556 [Zizania palustris]|uniref:Uncharacterized protein n=1 Tax=Zizania palustris TaxID=103762 RepID=A0A8J5WZL1_ZIZPA|nr:hypothetical protein GUJ93_ZPchr0013g34556 [Zizania palustris]
MAPALQPAAAAATTTLWPRLLPSPRRNAATQEHPHRIPSLNQLQPKRPLSAGVSHKSRFLVVCTSSGSYAEQAVVSTAHHNLSRIHFFDSVPDTCIIFISGYWTGPDVDDGCGNVVAILQRIA